MPFFAIICANRPAGDSAGALRANLHFAGQTLLEYQVRQAAEAGAGHVMILVGAVTQALSQAVDRLTADGIAVVMIRDMVSLVREAPRDQDMLLVADGVIVPQRYYAAMAGEVGNALLVTEDTSATANFERVEAGLRWTGLARISPDVLFGTLDMIGDWDLELTLVRAAVQRGARHVPVPAEDVVEGRLALVDRQAAADLVAEGLLQRPQGSGFEAGAERYLLSHVAARIAPPLLRSQVPPEQVRIGSTGLSAIAFIAILLGWPVVGILLLLTALVLSLTVDRLFQLARRKPAAGLVPLLPRLLLLVGIALLGREAGSTLEGLYLAALLGMLVVVTQRGGLSGLAPWMVFTPGSALLLLLTVTIGGYFGAGLTFATLCAIASVGAALILPRRKGN